ncbi:SDR family NAD(P)-dependent oxidoreductase [Halobacillus halophilus]|uniref:SDR family NAD(P)-dependent oxidoreductase n=1 Tax=Halobacillus halophilus TaxID=1570 RepID=UPI0013681853|nr:SDR family oxidoreductase [Halobacillus halophilus]MYL30350.1 SDR family NAD(P)-dependent oxidoreductase [Halobacillus halophilus]
MAKIWITGAGTGLGRALAHTYAREGNAVVLSGRKYEPLAAVQREIEQNGGSAEVIVCDITTPSSIASAVENIEHVDVLINNAGTGIFGGLSTYSEDDIDQLLDTNVKGTILMTQAVLPRLQQSKGRVLNIISTAGLRGKKNESIYCASKFALRGFTESLQKEWEEESLTATAVYMGGMNTPFWKDTDHVKHPEKMKSPEVAAEQIYKEDDGRAEIFVDR